MDLEKVKQLIALMQTSDIHEVEIKEGDDAIRVVRSAPAAAPAAESRTAVATSVVVESNSVEPASTAKGFVVVAPMVGTYYQAPSPNSPAFVQIGDRVKEGDVICIIESMKMMNQIKAECSGVIEAVLVKNEQPVEYDQPLFTIV